MTFLKTNYFAILKMKGGPFTNTRLNNQQFRNALFISGLTQDVFAEQTGITARYVRKLCKKSTNVSLSLYCNIITVLDLPWGALLEHINEAIDEVSCF